MTTSAPAIKKISQRLATLAYSDPKLEVARYKETKRPVNPFLSTKSFRSIPLSIKNNLFLPVVRYSGLYYSSDIPISSTTKEETKEKKEYCGKFYYVEPNSNTLLDLGVTAIFASKIHGLYVLTNEAKKRGLISSVTAEHKELEKYFEQTIYNLLYSMDMPSRAWSNAKTKWKNEHPKETKEEEENDYREAFDDYYFTIAYTPADVKIIPFLTHSIAYPCMPFLNEDQEKVLLYQIERGEMENYWRDWRENISERWSERNMTKGAHDFADQDLCFLARILGIDTVIMQHEIGEFRAVTEILDTRPDSMKKHLYVKEPPGPSIGKQGLWWKPKLKTCSTFWFVHDGLIRNGKMFHNFIIDYDDANLVKVEVSEEEIPKFEGGIVTHQRPKTLREYEPLYDPNLIEYIYKSRPKQQMSEINF